MTNPAIPGDDAAPPATSSDGVPTRPLSPASAAQLEATLAARNRDIANAPVLAELDAGAMAALRDLALLGGYAEATGLTIGEHYDVRFLGRAGAAEQDQDRGPGPVGLGRAVPA